MENCHYPMSSTYKTFRLRNEEFRSLGEVKTAIRQALAAFNEAPFQKREDSRYLVYLGEKPYLHELPALPYETLREDLWRMCYERNVYYKVLSRYGFLQEAKECLEEANIFLDIETLCSRTSKNETTVTMVKAEKTPHKSMDALIQELIGERLLTLSQYVSLDPLEKVLRVDVTWLKNDGYRLILH